jgi:hypothetical protein
VAQAFLAGKMKNSKRAPWRLFSGSKCIARRVARLQWLDTVDSIDLNRIKSHITLFAE